MGNRGIVRGTRESELLPRGWVSTSPPVAPITSNIMNVPYMGAIQTNQCALVPDAVQGIDNQNSFGLGLDGGGGHPYDPSFLGNPGVINAYDYVVGGNTFGVGTPVPTTGQLWNVPKSTGLPWIRDESAPGGSRIGGNMTMTGHMITLGGIYMTGSYTVNSPPVDPQNQFYDIWANRSYTITGAAAAHQGANSFGRPNYFTAAFTPTITTTTNMDSGDVYGAVLSAPSVQAQHVSTWGPQATISIMYASTVGAGTGVAGNGDGFFNTPPTGSFSGVVATSGAWFNNAASSIYGSWSDVTSSVAIKNGVIHNLTAGTAGGTFTVSGHLVGTAFSPNVPGGFATYAGSIFQGVSGNITVSGQVWGCVYGYPNQFQVANLFGTNSTTAPKYAVDIQGTGPLGAISMPALASQGTRAASGFMAIYGYVGASSGNDFLIIENNKASTTTYTAIKVDTNGTVTVSNASTLPT